MTWEQPGAAFSDLLAKRASSQQLTTDLAGYSLYQTEEFRWLVTAGDSIQSVMDRGHPAALVLSNQRAMGEIALQLHPSPKHCLDLGTGGGAFLRFLSNRLPAAKLESVEINLALVALARRHFGIPEEQAIHVGDAQAYLRSNATHFDLVLVDLFLVDRAPESTQTVEFFQLLAARLSESGVVAVNTLPHSSQEMRDQLGAAMDVFPYMATLQFEDLGNVLLFLSFAPLPNKDALARAITPRLRADELAVELLGSWQTHRHPD